MIRDLVATAFGKLSEGFCLKDRVVDMDLGRDRMKIEDALLNGQKLNDPFNDAEFKFVEEAFLQYGQTPPSMRISDCCVALIRLAN